MHSQACKLVGTAPLIDLVRGKNRVKRSGAGTSMPRFGYVIFATAM